MGRLRCRRGEARINDDQLCAFGEPFGECGYLRGKDVFTNMAADEHHALRLFQIDRLRRIDRTAEGKLIPDVTRSPALRECRLRRVRRAISFHQGGEESRMHAVRKQRHALRAIFVLQLLQVRREKVQRLIPAHAPKLAFAALTGSDLRILQPVGVIQQRGAGVTTGAQFSLGQRMVRVPLQLEHLAIGHFGHHPAPPETHLAVGGNLLNAGVAPPSWRMDISASCAGRGSYCGRCRRNLQEVAARHSWSFGGWIVFYVIAQ